MLVGLFQYESAYDVEKLGTADGPSYMPLSFSPTGGTIATSGVASISYLASTALKPKASRYYPQEVFDLYWNLEEQEWTVKFPTPKLYQFKPNYRDSCPHYQAFVRTFLGWVSVPCMRSIVAISTVASNLVGVSDDFWAIKKSKNLIPIIKPFINKS